jgi:hypothetical protein
MWIVRLALRRPYMIIVMAILGGLSILYGIDQVAAVYQTLLRTMPPASRSRSDRGIPPAAQKEIKSVELEIDRIEAETFDRAQSATLDRFQQIMLLGKLIFYDKELSVKRNETCSF